MHHQDLEGHGGKQTMECWSTGVLGTGVQKTITPLLHHAIAPRFGTGGGVVVDGCMIGPITSDPQRRSRGNFALR